MTQLIERAAVEQVFGSKENLDAQIKEFKDALKAHSKSKNKPAPTAHGVVEVIVRQHNGKYDIVDPPKQEFVDVGANRQPVGQFYEEPSYTFGQLKEMRLSDLADLRYNRQMEGVSYKNHDFNGDPLTLNALMAALLGAEDEVNILVVWKDARGDFVELEKADMVAIVKLIRDLTQACFNNENRLTKLIKATNDERALSRVNITTGWPE